MLTPRPATVAGDAGARQTGPTCRARGRSARCAALGRRTLSRGAGAGRTGLCAAHSSRQARQAEWPHARVTGAAISAVQITQLCSSCAAAAAQAAHQGWAQAA
jgi:hypothetical protein